MVQDYWRKIKKARQRLVLFRLMIDMMRTVHGAYAPASERFGTRLETFFIALCVTLGDIDGKPSSVVKIASYVRAPRTTVIRRLNRLQSGGLIEPVLFRKGRLVGCGGRQNQLEQGPVFAVRRCSKLAAMLLDDHAGNGKSQSHSARFRRDKRIKYAL